MAGAMRKMGIYLGLVEDDDARAAYGRYDARQSGYDDDVRDDRRGDRRDRYAYDEGYSDSEYPSTEFASDEVPVEELAAPEPAPVLPRRSARRLDLAPATGLGSPSAPRIGNAVASGPVAATATSVAVREPAVAPQPMPVQAPPVAKAYRITTLHPRTYNEARTIGERFRDGQPVIMNLTEMDDADAKRLVDFAAGLSFGLHGSIERVTAKVFLLSPQGTDVTAEDKARIREVGFFNQS